jgi:hypothetical protein
MTRRDSLRSWQARRAEAMRADVGRGCTCAYDGVIRVQDATSAGCPVPGHDRAADPRFAAAYGDALLRLATEEEAHYATAWRQVWLATEEEAH